MLTHLAVAIADGADCLSQLAVLRDQEALFGPVASYATAWRAVQAVASVELRGIDVARASARAAVWAAGGAPEAVTLDFDATLVDAHSDKQDATPTYKRGSGPIPSACGATRRARPWPPCCAPARGGHTAAHHVKMLDAALAQLPPEWRAGHGRGDEAAAVLRPILARADSAGATHGFVDTLVERNIGYSIGFDVDNRVRNALLLAQEEDWCPPSATAASARGMGDRAQRSGRPGTWPASSRLICRRERPHPGAQLSLFDTNEGFRHTCFLTDSAGEPPTLELRQRRHARWRTVSAVPRRAAAQLPLRGLRSQPGVLAM